MLSENCLLLGTGKTVMFADKYLLSEFILCTKWSDLSLDYCRIFPELKSHCGSIRGVNEIN